MKNKKIWHEGTDVPERGKKILLKLMDSKRYKLVCNSSTLTRIWSSDLVEKWAYVEDLNRIEEQINITPSWEQRRYEIAKEMLSAIYIDDGNAQRSNTSDIAFEYKDLEVSAKEAVNYADALINELKKTVE